MIIVNGSYNEYNPGLQRLIDQAQNTNILNLFNMKNFDI